MACTVSPEGRIGFLERLHSADHPVLVFDGATGTSLQQMDLSAEDFGGAALEGCNENLVFTRPDVVKEVHRQFLEVGADAIETNTFGAASIVLAEYDLQDQAFAISRPGKCLHAGGEVAHAARFAAVECDQIKLVFFVIGALGDEGDRPTVRAEERCRIRRFVARELARLAVRDRD
mgnify:CR=1 FL=1